jgi:hypothetical protein
MAGRGGVRRRHVHGHHGHDHRQRCLAFDAGLTTFPQAFGLVLMVQVTSRIYPRVGPRRMLAIGLFNIHHPRLIELPYRHHGPGGVIRIGPGRVQGLAGPIIRHQPSVKGEVP